MDKIREIVTYEDHFEKFLKAQNIKVQNKIYKVLEIIETIERIPTTYLKHIQTTDGLYEARIRLANDQFRVFCFFDGNRLVILLGGFRKKTQKTPKNEILRAQKLMNQYYEEQ